MMFPYIICTHALKAYIHYGLRNRIANDLKARIKWHH